MTDTPKPYKVVDGIIHGPDGLCTIARMPESRAKTIAAMMNSAWLEGYATACRDCTAKLRESNRKHTEAQP